MRKTYAAFTYLRGPKKVLSEGLIDLGVSRLRILGVLGDVNTKKNKTWQKKSQAT